MKNKKWYVISTFVLGCIVVNFAGRILSDRLQLRCGLILLEQ